jgi:hypothetical protein
LAALNFLLPVNAVFLERLHHGLQVFQLGIFRNGAGRKNIAAALASPSISFRQ